MMQEAIFTGSAQLPQEIVRALRHLIRRARTALVVRGLSIVGAVALGSILVVMGLDACITLFSPAARWALSSIVYGATLIAALWFIVRPLARSYTLTGMARIIEQRHPEMQERISSVVELLTSQDKPELRGSEALIEALTKEAIHEALIVKPRQEVSMRRLTPFVSTAAVLAVIFGGLFTFMPRQTAFLLARAAVPFANLPNVFATDMKVKPGDVVVGEGTTVQVLVNVTNRRVLSSRLRRSGLDGVERTEEMALTATAPGQDRTFAITFPAVKETFRYRVHAGDALSRYYTVRVVPPPSIAGVDLALQYPAYSGIAPRTETDSGGTIRALAGTKVDVIARVNKEMRKAQVVITTTSSTTNVPGVMTRTDDGKLACRFKLDLPPGLTGLWSIQLTDEFGLSNSKFERTIQAIPDLAPLVKVLHLEQKELRLNPTEILPVFFSAEDDYGVLQADLLLDVDGKKSEERLAIAAAGAAPEKKVEQQAAIDLSEPRFKGAQRVTFQVRALDNLPMTARGPQSGVSGAFTIVLDSNVASFDEQVLNTEEQQLRQELKKAQQELSAARDIVKPLAEAIAKEDKTLSPEAGKKVDEVANRVATADNAVRKVAEDIQDGFYGDMSRKLEEMAESHITKAADLAEAVRLTDEPKERETKAKEAAKEIDASLEAVQEALQDLDKVTPAVRRAVELANLSEKQDRLADAKTAMEQQGTNAAALPPEEWQKAQDKIADELAQLLKSTPGATNDVLDAIQEQAAAAADEGARLANEQKDISEEMQRLAALQLADKVLQDLAKEQALLAAQLRTNAVVADQFDPMKRIAEAISANDLDKAMPEQKAVAAALRDKADQLSHPLLPEEQQKEAQKVAGLEKQQEDLRKKVADQVDQRDKALEQIATEQAKLATEARGNPQAAAQADSMARAAEALKAEQPRQAMAQQEAIEKALAEARAQALKPQLTPQQQQDLQKIDDVVKKQDDLKKKVGDLTEQRNKALQELAGEQEKLATEAKADPAAATQAKTMSRAAEEIKTDQPRKATEDQQAASKALTAAADKLKQTPNATAEQQQEAQKLADMAKHQDDLQKKVTDLTEQRNKAMQELAGAQEKLAADAKANPATAAQAEPMAKAAEAIKADQPRTAMAKQDAALNALKKAEEPLLKPQPTAQQQQEAQKLAAIEKKQAALQDKVQAVAEKREQEFQKLAAEQEKLAAQAKADPRTAPQADPMMRAADAIKTDQPRQAMPQQDAIQKGLDDTVAQLKQSAQPTPQQQQLAQAINDLAQKQEDVNKKVAELAAQEKKELQNMATEQAKLATEAKSNPSTVDEAEKMAKAAEAIKAGRPETAIPAQMAAEKALTEALQTLEHPKPTSEQEKKADRIEDIAKEQAELRQNAAKASEDATRTLNDLAKQQENLAFKAKADPLTASQADSMKRAADALKSAQPAQALAQQEAAEKAMAAKAAEVKQNPNATTAQKQQAQEALELSKEQADLKKEVANALAEQKQDMQKLAAEQQKLATEAKADAAAAPQSEPLKRAAESMKQAADAMLAGQRGQTAAAQVAAEKGLADAAQQMSNPQPSPQQHQQAQKTEDLLDRQQALRQKLADFAARDAGIYSAQKDEQVAQLQAQQADVAKAAAELAKDVRETRPQDDKIETDAAKSAQEAATQLGDKSLADANRSAIRAGAELGRLADRLQDAAEAELNKAPPDTRSPALESPAEKLMALAERADDLADEQKQVVHEIRALATDKPVTELMEKQQGLREQAEDFSHLAYVLKEQAHDMGLPPQALMQANQGAENASRALQESAQAAKMLQDLNRPPQTDTPPAPIPPASQQAIQQAQANASQALANAAKALDEVNKTLAQIQPPPTAQPPSQNPSLPNAYEQAREAAETQTPLDSMQAAASLEQAAAQAAQQAQAMGANPKPDSQKLMASSGRGMDPNKAVEGETPTWGFKVGMKLRNWLHMKGELKDEVLQASPDDGPEEYRGLIKSYFNEVSRRGGNEP